MKLQDPGLRQALRPYTLKGNFGALLDAQSDGLRDGRFQVFEMAHLMELGDRIVIPALLYLFHRIEQRLDGRPTLIILEEAWTYLLHELFAERIQLWLKELRKYNAAVWQGLRQSRPVAARLGLRDPLDDDAWFTLFILVVRQRGREGGNRPFLCHQQVERFGTALAHVAQGQTLFLPEHLQCEELAAGGAVAG